MASESPDLTITVTRATLPRQPDLYDVHVNGELRGGTMLTPEGVRAEVAEALDEILPA